MCSRFAVDIKLEHLPGILKEVLSENHKKHFAPRPIVRPSEPVLALRQNEGKTEASLMLWGLIPSWTKDLDAGPRPFNARSETIAEKATFRGAWRNRRCTIPASSFYEKGFRIRKKDCKPFWLAGLWDRWGAVDGSELDTCTVLTTDPNELIRPLHNRMPVIIPEGLEEAWIKRCDGTELHAFEPLLSGWEPDNWIAEPISKETEETEQLSFLS